MRDSGRKYKLTGKGHPPLKMIVAKYHETSKAKMRVELNTHSKFHGSTKTVRRELHKPKIHKRAATSKPFASEGNPQVCKRKEEK